jgi:hypothetical protein
VVRPERRTRADVLVAGAIAVVVAVVAGVIWWTSDARATVSRPAASPVPTLRSAATVPTSLRELWTAPSGATTEPVVVLGAVITGDGRAVQGRSPSDGAVLWSYERDLDLCGVTWVYNYAVAVYPDERGCGQVSTVDARTGLRGPSRTSYADRRVRLSGDGTTVLSAGDTRLEMWRSDMVRMLSYGALDAPLNPGKQPSPLCRLVSAAASSSAVSVLEACPNQPDLRLTLLKPAKEEDTPDLKYVRQPGLRDGTGARVVAVTDTTTALYVPTPAPRVDIIDETGSTVDSTVVDGPPSPASVVTRAGDLITWWTGRNVMVFSANGFRYKYTLSGTAGDAPLGPATLMAGRLLVPVRSGYAVYDPATGALDRRIPLPRPAGDGPVVPNVAGTTVLEQRGGQLAALG